ncbi:MAG: tetratricopeptide repeat protein [Alphaproteobacteria bacterium]|nr:tetratricopeptide repeat protein [Alphaproteobacteria bacterium]
MKLWAARGSILFVLFGASPAAAQMAVTTLGASDAAACYEQARSDFGRDTAPCDRALASVSLSQGDRKRTLVNRGIIENRNRDLAAAIEDFDAALRIDSGLGEAVVNRGNSHFLAGRLDQALADYKAALELGVSKPWAAWYNIGLVYEAKNERSKARDAYERALKLNPDFELAKARLRKIDLQSDR